MENLTCTLIPDSELATMDEHTDYDLLHMMDERELDDRLKKAKRIYKQLKRVKLMSPSETQKRIDREHRHRHSVLYRPPHWHKRYGRRVQSYDPDPDEFILGTKTVQRQKTFHIRRAKRQRRAIKKQERKLEQAKIRTKEKRKKKKHTMRGYDRVPLDKVPDEYYIEPRIFNAMSRSLRQRILRERDVYLRREDNVKKKAHEQEKKDLRHKVRLLVCRKMNHALLTCDMDDLDEPVPLPNEDKKLLQLYKRRTWNLPVKKRWWKMTSPRKPLDLVHALASIYLNDWIVSWEYDANVVRNMHLFQITIFKSLEKNGQMQWHPEKWVEHG